MGRLLGAVLAFAALSTNSYAVSVIEIASKCGDDGKQYCAGVGYGDPMQACLTAHYAKLQPACKVIIDRLKAGEKVSLF